ncbi:MAG: DUF4139 domain-containing protein, partial [Bacteroidia bacterium]|nr:DUF4139 domain-containing protein [Bacteroidia bacterium]
MKHLIIILASVLPALSFGQTTKTITSKPDKATVYLTGAELTHIEQVSLANGMNEIILEGVSPNAEEGSISAIFKGAGFVIDTRKSYRYPEQLKNNSDLKKYARELALLIDSIEEINFLLIDTKNKLTALEKEKYLLLNNRLMKGEFEKDSIGLLKGSLDLLRSRLNNIDENHLACERKQAKQIKIQTYLYQRKDYLTLLQENGGDTDLSYQIPVYQLIITINADQPSTGSLIVKYYIAGAGWIPLYDIQASSGKEKINLIYRGQVYQNSGINWKDIDLKLSTSNPAYGNEKPMLSAWRLYFEDLNSASRKPASATFSNNGINQYQYRLKEKKADVDDLNEETVEAAPIFSVTDNFMNTEYDIKVKYSIVSDNKPHNVIINSLEIPVSLAYSSVPKLDKDAFLMGKIANWEDWKLIPGTAKIYFDDSYIGQTIVDPETTKDTLYLNLGRDKSIIIKRLPVKEKTREQTIGDNTIVTKVFEITVRNTKGVTLPFEIEDQIPITSESTIKI